MTNCDAFKARVRALKDDPPEFYVLLWGPAAGESLEARKRSELRDKLLENRFQAAFSEDLAEPEGNVSEEEANQARAADMIVILRSSPGSIAEFHEYALLEGIPPKLLVWVNEQHKDGFSSKGLGQILRSAHDCVFDYSESDLEQCNVVKKTVEKAIARRYIKTRQRRLA